MGKNQSLFNLTLIAIHLERTEVVCIKAEFNSRKGNENRVSLFIKKEKEISFYQIREDLTRPMQKVQLRSKIEYLVSFVC